MRHTITTTADGYRCSCGMAFEGAPDAAQWAYVHADQSNAVVLHLEPGMAGTITLTADARVDANDLRRFQASGGVLNANGYKVYVVVNDQPPPVATDRVPAWDIVIAMAIDRRDVPGDAYGPVHDLLIQDMRERDALGRARYGVPLTAGNGRHHLVDAYQERLDGAVYLAAWLDEHSEDTLARRFIAAMLDEDLRTLVRMRAFIEDGL